MLFNADLAFALMCSLSQYCNAHTHANYVHLNSCRVETQMTCDSQKIFGKDVSDILYHIDCIPFMRTSSNNEEKGGREKERGSQMSENDETHHILSVTTTAATVTVTVTIITM